MAQHVEGQLEILCYGPYVVGFQTNYLCTMFTNNVNCELQSCWSIKKARRKLMNKFYSRNKLSFLEASLESKNIKNSIDNLNFEKIELIFNEEAQKVKSLSPFDFIRG